jgi:S1-C subfamily serine protease
MPDVLEYAAVVSRDQALIDRQRQIVQDVNHSLEQQIVELKKMSPELVCRAPSGATKVTLAPLNLLPPLAQNIRVATPTSGGPTNAAQLADEAVVLVRSQFGNSHKTGSAFFISDQLLVTNDHVVSGPRGRDATAVTIENKALGKRIPVKVLARSHVSRPGDLDFSLLEAPASTSRAFLRLTAQPEKASSVRSLRFLGLAGNKGIPESIITDGIVSSVIESNGRNAIVHSAAIARENAGGPLMDLCSRAVGVNTWLLTSGGSPAGVSLAQPTAALLEFLKANGKTIALDTARCAPGGIAFGGPGAMLPASPASSPASPKRPPG